MDSSAPKLSKRYSNHSLRASDLLTLCCIGISEPTDAHNIIELESRPLTQGKSLIGKWMHVI